MKTSSSATASTVTKNSKRTACFTPRMLSQTKIDERRRRPTAVDRHRLELEMNVGAERRGDRRRRERELDQRRIARDETAERPESAARIGERPARVAESRW